MGCHLASYLLCIAIGFGRVTVTDMVCPSGEPTFTSDAESDDCLCNRFQDGDLHPYSLLFYNCNHFVTLYQFYGMDGECEDDDDG